MNRYIIFGFYNLLYQVLSICLLFYANTYLNSFFIPSSFRWKDGKLREDLTKIAAAQTVLLVVEGALLMCLMYYINKWYLLNIPKATNSNTIAILTSGVYGFITLAFIIFLMYVAFK